MLGKVDGRSRPTLADEQTDSRYLAVDEGYPGPRSDQLSFTRDPYDYGDPTWHETSQVEVANHWPDIGSTPTSHTSDEVYWLDDFDENVELSGVDWKEGFRPAHPTSWAARIGRVGAMFAITALIGVVVVIFSGSQAGVSFELAGDALGSGDDEAVDIDTGAQADTGSWFDEIPFINVSRRSADAQTEVAEVVETTTTTVWAEPAVEPESAWVDAGHGVAVPDLLLKIRFCESTNNYVASHTVSSARGAYQFLSKSWDWYGHAAAYGVSSADQASPAQQDEAAVNTYKGHGARPWAESRACWDSPDIDPRYATAKPPASATSTTSTTIEESTTTETTESDDSGSDSTESTTETTVGEEETTTTTEESSDTSAPAETTTTTEASDSGSGESSSTTEESAGSE